MLHLENPLLECDMDLDGRTTSPDFSDTFI